MLQYTSSNITVKHSNHNWLPCNLALMNVVEFHRKLLFERANERVFALEICINNVTNHRTFGFEVIGIIISYPT